MTMPIVKQDVVKGKVIKKLSNYELVINKGSLDGVSENHKFLVFYKEEELFDPDTKESLGNLEIVCGKGKVKHMQERITTIESSIYREITPQTIKKTASIALFGRSEEITQGIKEPIEFDHLNKADTELLVRQIK